MNVHGGIPWAFLTTLALVGTIPAVWCFLVARTRNLANKTRLSHKTRSPVPDEQFVQDCGIVDVSSDAASLAAALRRTIARLVDVPAAKVYASDELRRLPMWSDIDVVEFACALDNEIGIVLSDEQFPIRHFHRLPQSYSVAELVKDLVRQILPSKHFPPSTPTQPNS